MAYSVSDLRSRLNELYPELREQGVSLSLNFDSESQGYSLTLSKGNKMLLTHLGGTDADSCMCGTRYAHLDAVVDRFINKFAPGN